MGRWAWVVMLAGCSLEPTDLGPPSGAEDQASAKITWHEHVRPLFDEQCLACHHREGIGPFSMEWQPQEWAGGAPWWAAAAVTSVEEGTMPPWKPAEGCTPMMHERRLSPEEKALVSAWAAGGYEVGEESAYVPPSSPTGASDRPADLRLEMPEAFVPSREEPDDYRCFPLAYDGDGEAWLEALEVLPDQRRMVHHVILYQLGPDYADDVAAWDARDEGPGYDCLFDPGTWDSMFVGAWAPGTPPLRFPGGTARRLEEGSILVLQVHYNTSVMGRTAELPADRSGVNLWFLPEDVRPQQELVAIPFPVYPRIAAGDPNAVAEESITLADFLGYVPEVLVELFAPMVRNVGVYPHMHQLGTRITVDITRGDGTSFCLFDIPDWDFAWQQGYFFQDGAWYAPDAADTIRLRCEYDNSAENQPVIDGVRQEPRDVSWGEGTHDEMCLVFFETLLPAGVLTGF